MLTSHGWDVKCVEWPNNGLARVGQSHPVPGCPHSDCTYGAARIRALPSMQGARIDMMRLAIKRMRCKPSYRLLMGACLQAHRTTELFRLDICSMTEWFILRGHEVCCMSCLPFLAPRPTRYPQTTLAWHPVHPIIVSGSSEAAILHWDIPSLTVGPPAPVFSTTLLTTAAASTRTASHVTSSSAVALSAV